MSYVQVTLTLGLNDVVKEIWGPELGVPMSHVDYKKW